MRIEKFWVVTMPTKYSVLQDICFECTWEGLRLQFLGGLTTEEIAVYDNQPEAKSLAKRILAMHDCEGG